LPISHESHTAAPSKEACFAIGQLEHDNAALLEYLPPEHGAHEVDATRPLYVPAEQLVQPEAAAALYVPLSQLEQPVLAVPVE